MKNLTETDASSGHHRNMKKRPPESAVAVTWPQVAAFLDRPVAIDIASGG